MAKVTAQQVEKVWNQGGSIDLGNGSVTQQELGEMGDIDVDDAGNLGPDQAEVLADQINSFGA
ncbi:hypothetical protein [Streptomyces buecherae]|uniref:hypothetical protein n=1 Tax=Streptomyces buecherae TaxID=2763006 RepID=UPI0037B85E5E